ncbi:hypothetical protein Pa4123_83650 [Phytohabitans aurantiacus]|uniref:Uncharacterized protein n=1 Tax=Phytohabitans aurantiacus TaxID=3016789 RepID=A0ABQ5RAZ3_9ACTN|nr:hypothetical protein Pa4123_83650 [Phytohabitans aurantiacus]
MHQKIRPQTKTPTTRAAITDPIHRSYILFDCGVRPFSGQPKPLKALPTSQPPSKVISAAAPAPSPASLASRARVPLATTWFSLPSVTDRREITRPCGPDLPWGG